MAFFTVYANAIPHNCKAGYRRHLRRQDSRCKTDHLFAILKAKDAFSSMYLVADLAEFGVEPCPVFFNVFVRCCVTAIGNDVEYNAVLCGVSQHMQAEDCQV